ncbi:MAG: hypothetical protein ACWGO1_07005, partial [Anaerolineales bacterium]
SAQFNMQVIRLQKQGSGGFSPKRLVQVSPAEMVTSEAPNAVLSLSIPSIELETFNQVAIIITRMDVNEASDSSGAYKLIVTPGS